MFKTIDILDAIFGKEKDPVIEMMKRIFLLLAFLALVLAVLLSFLN